MKRLALYSVVCGGLVIGVALGYGTTRPLVAALDASASVFKTSQIAHGVVRMNGTIRTLSTDGYMTLETRDIHSFERIVSYYGKIDDSAQVSQLQIGDYVSASIVRSPGLLHFSFLNTLLRKDPVVL